MAKNREKDQAMAMYMKEHHITRTVARCPICHNVVSLDRLDSHMRTGVDCRPKKMRGHGR